MADPRAHRHARIMDGDRITYSCGCVNAIQDLGVLRSISKCDPHSRERSDPATLGRGYFERLGCFADGVPQAKRYIQELEEALGPFPRAKSADSLAMEVGCGVSMYCPALLRAGYLYVGLEPSRWAASATRAMYDAAVLETTLDDYDEGEDTYGLILAAHSIEHMDDAPGAIVKCAHLLRPGGELWIVVPNDDDPLNPDHTWTFSEPSLRRCVESAGLNVLNLESRRRIEREAFLYLRARKP